MIVSNVYLLLQFIMDVVSESHLPCNYGIVAVLYPCMMNLRVAFLSVVCLKRGFDFFNQIWCCDIAMYVFVSVYGVATLQCRFPSRLWL
jgi:hypothetical protein